MGFKEAHNTTLLMNIPQAICGWFVKLLSPCTKRRHERKIALQYQAAFVNSQAQNSQSSRTFVMLCYTQNSFEDLSPQGAVAI